MKKHFSSRAKWLIVISILLAMLVTISLAVNNSRPGESIVQTILTPFRSAGSALVREIEQYYNYIFQYEKLQAENKELKARIIAMALERIGRILPQTYRSGARAVP